MITLQEMIEVMQHFADGGAVEVSDRCADSWSVTTVPVWDWYEFEYRKRDVKPVVQWEYISPRYNYLAVDGDGCVYVYSERPTRYGGYWDTESTISVEVDTATFTVVVIPPGLDWAQSLVERPE